MPIGKGKMFVLPAPVIEDRLDSISEEAKKIIHSLDYFIVERARTSRRYLSALHHPVPIDKIVFEEIPEGDVSEKEIRRLLEPLFHGRNIGLLSEAGLPAVADPGNVFVKAALRQEVKVVPIAGPSSIMMALMASGLEGQRFSFHGYLSAKKNELPSELKKLAQRSDSDDATQIWIEAPYRNRQILEAVEKYVEPGREFCIAAGIGGENGFVKTMTISEWKKNGWPEIHKIPAVFLLK